MKFIPLLKALIKGRSLLNVETWKNVQMVSMLLSGIAFTVLKFFPDLVIDSQVIEQLIIGIAYIGSAIALYLTPATTEKIGLPNNEINTDISSGVDDDWVPMGDEAGNVSSLPNGSDAGSRGLHNGFK